MQAAEEADHEDDVVTDGQVSFYAKGRVLGSGCSRLPIDRIERDATESASRDASSR